jgi:Zn-dependent peptidase ImmA (M78 family)/DNA-binding XRE family transcriptional regulator
MSRPAVERARLRLARELKGWSQSRLARELGLTPAALSQFESGSARPTTQTLARLSAALEVPIGFFERPLVETHEGFFRSLRRTSITDRRRARGIAHLAHDLVSDPKAAKHVPPLSIPNIPAPQLSAPIREVEQIADQVRSRWELPPGPVDNVVDLLETHGVVVIRLPLDSAEVDAFSLPFPDHPVVVLGSDKNDRARSRFDAAHELGHSVMHRDQIWGIAETEKQAHAFAAAFLMPANDISDELPMTVDWPHLFDLKRRWQVSLAALLMRAKTLGRMSEATYLAAVKTASARGWRRVEPVPLGPPERPRLLLRLLNSPDGPEAGSHLPQHLIKAIADATTASL